MLLELFAQNVDGAIKMINLAYALILLAALGLLAVQSKEIIDRGSIWPDWDKEDKKNQK